MATPQMIQGRVEGLEESRRALEAILRAEKAAIPEVLEVVGQQGVTEIRRRAPLLTGRLRRSYTYVVDNGGRWVDLLSNLVYAPYQEFGTRYMTGTPHVRPAVESLIPQIPDLIAEGMARAGRGASGGMFRGGGSSLASISTRLGNLAA